MPEDEKKRLISFLKEIKLNKLFSDIVIINKQISLKSFKINKKKI